MKCIALYVLLCLSVTTHAQLHLGIKAGVQTAGARYTRMNEHVSVDRITGYNAGLITNVYFDDKVAFVSGLQFNARGFAVKTLPGDTLRTYRLHYLDIPLLIQIDLSKKRQKGLYTKFGPVISIGLYGKEIYKGSNGMEVRKKAILSMTGNNFGLFDASLNAMLGYSFSRKLFLEAGYAYGIGNINNDMEGPNIKSRVLSISAGWWLW